MPAQPLLSAAALVDEVVAMVDQQLQLAQPLLTRPRMIEPRLAKRRPGDGERVDRVRLAAHPAGAPLRRHQLRRHPHQPLARSEQLRSSARVSCRQSSTAHSRSARATPTRRQARPASRPSAPRRAPDLVDRDRRQRLLVHVHSNHDHSDRLLQPLGATGERTDLNRGSSHAPIRSRSAVSGRRRRHNAGKSDLGATCRNRVSRRRPESRRSIGRHRHPRMTLSSGMSLEPELARTGYRPRPGWRATSR